MRSPPKQLPAEKQLLPKPEIRSERKKSIKDGSAVSFLPKIQNMSSPSYAKMPKAETSQPVRYFGKLLTESLQNVHHNAFMDYPKMIYAHFGATQ